jgi:Fe2+ or Zn2+ uptake regulation protein
MTIITKNGARTRNGIAGPKAAGTADPVSRGRAALERTAGPRPSPPARGRAAASLRARGLRRTEPREVVLDVVRGTDSHPTAEQVHGMVRRRLPRVSLGTVYRNLRRLVEAGLVKELPGPHARFDGNASEHHHFTCTTCGRIVDVAGALADAPALALSARVASLTGLGITHQRIEFYGRCAECRARRARRPRLRRDRRSFS